MKHSCDDCAHGKRHYADGHVRKDWSGSDDPATLPAKPDPEKHWTYMDCAMNKKGLRYLNLTGDCPAFKE